MTPAEFERQFARDLARLREDARKAVSATAHRAVVIVRKNTPKAFGELRDSVHSTGTATVVSAPHAQAVEVGSRPHYVPLEELVAWVKLRGMQGISGRAHEGPTSMRQASRVAAGLRSLERNGSLSVDAPEKIAKRIQQAILAKGTKPHWFVQNSLPEVMEVLDTEMKKVFK